MVTMASDPRGATTSEQSLAERGGAALARHQWAEALEALSEADRRTELDAGGLWLLAEALWWSGRLPDSIEARERSYAAAMKAADHASASRAAIMLGRDNLYRNAESVAAGWLGRAASLLEHVPENEGHGWLAIVRSFRASTTGDLDGALAAATEAAEIGRRIGSRDLTIFGQAERGFALVQLGRREEGMPLIDEAAVVAVSGELEAGVAGGICCTTIGACAALGEYGRAAEWTEAQDRWCKREGINGYPGMCRLYRSEVKQLRGQWLEAEAEARQASVELVGFIPAAAAAALYRIASLRLQRGDLDAAEDALTKVHAMNAHTEPAYSLLQLARGRTAVALESIRRALDEPNMAPSWDASPNSPLGRAPLLRAQVEIAVAAGELGVAQRSIEELEVIAKDFGSTALDAGVATARGAARLAEGNFEAARSSLRDAVDGWTRLDAPYEAARARILLGRANLAGGDPSRAALELRAALETFDGLGATIDAREARVLLGNASGEEDAPPSGASGQRQVKTFAFTDIVDSTKLGELLGDEAWTKLLRWHDGVVRAVVAEHGGEEVKATGDGFFLAFDDPGRAVEAMIALQRRLAEQRDTQGFAPAIRIGVHTAEATRAGSDYVGTGVNQAARIAAAAAGSEILVSEAALADARRSFADAGRRTLELKGIAEPMPVVAIAWR